MFDQRRATTFAKENFAVNTQWTIIKMNRRTGYKNFVEIMSDLRGEKRTLSLREFNRKTRIVNKKMTVYWK